MDRRKFIQSGIALGTTVSAPALVLAQSASAKWPSQPVQLVVAFSPGGSTDVTARIISAKLMDITHIAYKGAAAALNDIASGVTDFGFTSALSSIPSIQAGRLTPLAVASSKRLALLPNVPTMAEAGIVDFEITFWNGLFAPAGTPREIIDRLSAACASIANMKEVEEIFAAQASVVTSSTPEEYKEFLTAEIKMWGDVVRLTGASAN